MTVLSIIDLWGLSALCSFGYFAINFEKPTLTKMEIILTTICAINFTVFCVIAMVAALPA